MKMKNRFAQFLTISFLLAVPTVAFSADRTPFFQTETVDVPGHHTLYLGYVKIDDEEENSRLYPLLNAKETRDEETVFRFRFRQRGIYRLRFQQQDNVEGKLSLLEKEIAVGAEDDCMREESEKTKS